MTQNEKLKAFYDAAYTLGEAKVFSFFENGKPISEDHQAVLSVEDWSGKTVIDVGCGTGLLAREIGSRAASRVIGLDYSASAIAAANSARHPPNVEFVHADVTSWSTVEKFDVVTALGTVEHFDDPARFLKSLGELLSDDGTMILTCPHFLNPRGYALMALAILLKVPISLSDLHFIHPWHMVEWAERAGLHAELVATVDRNWAYGPQLLKDFDKRLRNALRDAELPTENVDTYLDYIHKLVDFLGTQTVGAGMDGAVAVWRLRRAATSIGLELEN